MKYLTSLKSLIKEKREEIKAIKKAMKSIIKSGAKAFYDGLKVKTPQLEIDWSTDSEYNDEGGTYTTYQFMVQIDDNNRFGYDWG